MTCRRLRRHLIEYLGDDLDRGERAAIESHLDGCSPCRRRASGLRRLWRSLPEPYPAALQPPPEVWEDTWKAVLDHVACAPAEPAEAVQDRRPAAWRWAAVAAALCAAFLLGRHWDGLSQQALRLAGLTGIEGGGYFSGLASFQRDSGHYLLRSRLLLMELQQTGAAAQGVDDPWLAGHSRSLLGEAPRHLTAARRIRNPHLEQLLAELEQVLQEILELSGGGGGKLPQEIESELSRLLFKLEMLEQPRPASRGADAAPAAL